MPLARFTSTLQSECCNATCRRHVPTPGRFLRWFHLSYQRWSYTAGCRNFAPPVLTDRVWYLVWIHFPAYITQRERLINIWHHLANTHTNFLSKFIAVKDYYKTFSLILRRTPLCRSPAGVRVAGCRHNKKRHSTLFLDNWKLRNFLRLVKNAADSRCLVDMLYLRFINARALTNPNISYLREASAGLLVQLTGQCEGLQLWNEQLVWLSRFFCCLVRIVSRWHNKF